MIAHSWLPRNKETSKAIRNRKICAGREKLSGVHSTGASKLYNLGAILRPVQKRGLLLYASRLRIHAVQKTGIFLYARHSRDRPVQKTALWCTADLLDGRRVNF